MSDNVDRHAIEYRALVASFSKELTAEETYHAAYIWLTGKEDTSKYSPSSNSNVCGLEIFAKLERHGIFSRQKIEGLVEIAKRLNRYDLVDKVNAYKKKKGESYGTRYAKTKASTRSEERQYFEQTFEVMVTQMAVLEQQLSLLQTILRQKTDIELLDEGMDIIEKSGTTVHELASKLSTVKNKLGRRSRADSASSRSSDSSGCGSLERPRMSESACSKDTNDTSTGSNFLVPRPVVSTPAQLSLPKKDKPVPKPRPQKAQHGHFEIPIQESVAENSTHCHRNPPPVAPKPSCKAKQNPRQINTPELNSSLSTVTEESDWTGDSGMGTGSGTAAYEVIVWKNAIQHPPPERRTHSYQTIRRETRDDDEMYQEPERI